MVIREAHQTDSANDKPTLTSRVWIVYQGWARWVSAGLRVSMTALCLPNVSTIPLKNWKQCALSKTCTQTH